QRRHSVGANKRTHGICTWRTTFAILRASHIRLRTSVGALASNAKALPQREYRDASRHVSLLTRSVCAYSLAAWRPVSSHSYSNPNKGAAAVVRQGKRWRGTGFEIPVRFGKHTPCRTI